MVVQEAPVAVRITAQLEIITTPVRWVKWAFIPLQHPTIWGILITSKGTNCQSCFILNYINKWYFLYIHRQIRLKPILLYFVGPKRPSGNCSISCFLIDNTALHIRDVTR